MFRIILLALISPLVIACQQTPAYLDEPSPNATLEDAISEPTDGIENEIGAD